eukprot:3176629-Pyramimonas_sp.AAC.1
MASIGDELVLHGGPALDPALCLGNPARGNTLRSLQESLLLVPAPDTIALELGDGHGVAISRVLLAVHAGVVPRLLPLLRGFVGVAPFKELHAGFESSFGVAGEGTGRI